MNGSKTVCKDDNGEVTQEVINLDPYNKTIHFGTKSYEDTLQKAEYNCAYMHGYGIGNSTYHSKCIDNEMQKLW